MLETEYGLLHDYVTGHVTSLSRSVDCLHYPNNSLLARRRSRLPRGPLGGGRPLSYPSSRVIQPPSISTNHSPGPLSPAATQSQAVHPDVSTADVDAASRDSAFSVGSPVASPSSVAAHVKSPFRPPRPVRADSVTSDPSDAVVIDGFTYRQLVQDLTQYKTSLLKLKRLIQEDEIGSPFTQAGKNGYRFSGSSVASSSVTGLGTSQPNTPLWTPAQLSSSADPSSTRFTFDTQPITEETATSHEIETLRQENELLKVQIKALTQQAEEQEATVHLLQQQMTKYECGFNGLDGQAFSTVGVQTEKEYAKLCLSTSNSLKLEDQLKDLSVQNHPVSSVSTSMSTVSTSTATTSGASTCLTDARPFNTNVEKSAAKNLSLSGRGRLATPKSVQNIAIATSETKANTTKIAKMQKPVATVNSDQLGKSSVQSKIPATKTAHSSYGQRSTKPFLANTDNKLSNTQFNLTNSNTQNTKRTSKEIINNKTKLDKNIRAHSNIGIPASKAVQESHVRSTQPSTNISEDLRNGNLQRENTLNNNAPVQNSISDAAPKQRTGFGFRAVGATSQSNIPKFGSKR